VPIADAPLFTHQLCPPEDRDRKRSEAAAREKMRPLHAAHRFIDASLFRFSLDPFLVPKPNVHPFMGISF
jgi:hypothetical protein